LIGTGYFLDQNLKTQYKNNWNSCCDYLGFGPGSEGSRIYGLTLGPVYIACGNIIISKNKIDNISLCGTTNFSDITISQNYMDISGVRMMATLELELIPSPMC